MPVNALQAAAVTATTATRKPAEPTAGGHTFAGALAHASSTSAANTPDSVLDAKKAPKGEQSTPVKGHAYADVTAGPRNGMYINTSGNKRDGQAFVLVKRDGKEYHIYGSGKDRLVVCLKPKKDDADHTAPAKPKPETKSTAPSGTTGSA
jgi:hypothetical protein